jgi:hypothetical protein
MVKIKRMSFHEYRYQILPITQNIQFDLKGEIKSLDDLKRKKNEYLEKVAVNVDYLKYARTEIRHKLLWAKDNIIIFQIGVERDLKRRTREFELEEVENWPTVFAILNNDPTIQKCLVQEQGGFQSTSTVIKILEESLNPFLRQHQLAIVFEPIYNEQYFWDLITQYKDRVTQIEFELISPNMSNISSSLKLDLGALNKSTNTQRTNLQLNSNADSFLTPSNDDPIIKGLVEYSSNGGGDITIRVKGIRKKYHTSRGVKQTSIDELTITGSSPEDIAKTFEGIMK